MSDSGKRTRQSSGSDFQDIFSDTSHKVNKKHFKKKKKHPALRRIGILLLSLIFIGSGYLMVFYYNTLDSMVYAAADKFNTGSSASLNPVDLKYNGDLLNDPMVLNIMLFGSDTRSTSENGRSDTMIMLSLDNRTKKIKMSSFLRDLWVEIPGYGNNRLNAAYSFGGPGLTILTLESNFGIQIDRYAVVDFSSFKSIIDIMGGIDIELTEFEISYINWQMYENGQVSDPQYIKSDPGIVHLNGTEALWHARNRDSALSDFDRTDRQRQVLNVIINTLKTSSFSQIIDIISEVGPMITTNFKKSEITALVKNALTYLSYDVEQFKLPTSDNYYGDKINDMSVLVISDWEQARLDLAKFVFEDKVSDKSPSNTDDNN